MSMKKWNDLCYSWLVYTFVLFLFIVPGLALFSLAFNEDKAMSCAVGSSTTEMYFITSLLFFITLCAKLGMMATRRTLVVGDLLVAAVFLYGCCTHYLMYTSPGMFILQSPAMGGCIPIVEVMQWQLTCPLLFLSLFTNARKISVTAARTVLAEHITIVACVVTTLVPWSRAQAVAAVIVTACNLAVKVSLLRLFYPVKNVLDMRLAPFLGSILLLYIVFPAIYAAEAQHCISASTQLCLYAVADLGIKLVYAVLLEYCEHNVALLNIADVLDLKRKDTIEMLFLRYIFHEVRNPLSSLSSAIDDLSEVDSRQMYVRQLRSGVDSLGRLLDDMKQLIEMQEGRAVLSETMVRLEAVVANCIVQTQPAAGASVQLTVEKHIPELLADEYRLAQITLACVFYALQRRDDNFPVKVTLAAKRTFGEVVAVHMAFQYVAAEFSELKTGYEAPMRLRPEKVNSKYSIEYSFGIRLAEYVADLYLGTVSVQEGPGKAERQILVDLQLLKYRAPRSMLGGAAAAAEEAPGCVARAAREPLKILIVDDNLIVVKHLDKICKGVNSCVQCDWAHDGVQAVAMSKLTHYHLIFMDIVMAQMDGVQATRLIHKHNPGLQIYGMSANSFKSDLDELTAAGAVAAWSKPVPRTLIESTVQQALDSQREQQRQ